MNQIYGTAFKEQALIKVYSRGDRTIKSVADELNMNTGTLKNWMKAKLKQTRSTIIAGAVTASHVAASGSLATANATTNANTNSNTNSNTRDTAPPIHLKDKRPADWRVEERLVALHQTYGLSDVAKSAWCRQNGLFPHDLVNWQSAFYNTGAGDGKPAADKQALRQLKTENQQLQHQLSRKDKALAEAAALLLLQKKFNALLGDEAL